MITRRVVINMVAFAAVVVLLLVYGLVDLLGNPFGSRPTVYTVFPDVSGLTTGFPVSWNGIDVGSITSVRLVKRGVRVGMTLDHDVTIPADVTATVDIANNLGEQQVELTAPSTPGRPDPPLRNGSRVAAGPNSTPADIGNVLNLATRLTRAIPTGSLNQLVNELYTALAGRAADMRTIVDAGQVYADEALQYEAAFKALLANSPPVLDAINSQGSELRQALVNTAALLQVLSSKRYQLVNLLNAGSQAASAAGSLFASQGPDLACVIHDFAALNSNLSQPANFANLNGALVLNQWFFGAIKVDTRQGPAIALAGNAPAKPEQWWARTRLVLPEGFPQGEPYVQEKHLPPVEPGAGCLTALGAGVGPATQAGFAPYGQYSKVEPAPASESNVPGTGNDPPGSGTLSAYASRNGQGVPPGLTGLMLAVGISNILLAGFFTFGKSRRQAPRGGRVRRERT